MKIDECLNDDLRDPIRGNNELGGLRNEDFWRLLMSCKVDNVIRIHADVDDIITAAEVAVTDHTIVKIHDTHEACRIYVYCDGDNEAALTARAKYRYCTDGGAYDGMKSGIDWYIKGGWKFPKDKLKEFVEAVKTDPRFGLPGSIYY